MTHTHTHSPDNKGWGKQQYGDCTESMTAKITVCLCECVGLLVGTAGKKAHHRRRENKLGRVGNSCKPNIRRLRQDFHKFEASLSYRVKSCQEKKVLEIQIGYKANLLDRGALS